MSDTVVETSLTELQAELATLREEVGAVRALAQRAEDRGAVENLFNRYMYLHNAFQDEQIIPLWVEAGTPGIRARYTNAGQYTDVRERDPLPPRSAEARRQADPPRDDDAGHRGRRRRRDRQGRLAHGRHRVGTHRPEVAKEFPDMYSPDEVHGKKVWAHWVWCKYAIDFLKQDGEWKIWKFRCYELARAPFEENWISFGKKNQGASTSTSCTSATTASPCSCRRPTSRCPATNHPYSPHDGAGARAGAAGRRTTSSRTPSLISREEPTMATHNSLFSEKDVRRRADGIAVSVQLPWYRSLWLSAVDDVAASVNGVAVPKDAPALRTAGPSYRIAELPEQWDTLWFVADKPDVVIPLDHVPEAGEKIAVEVVLTMRLLYMQIMPGVDGGPGRYVTNRVPVEREVVLA